MIGGVVGVVDRVKVGSEVGAVVGSGVEAVVVGVVAGVVVGVVIGVVIGGVDSVVVVTPFLVTIQANKSYFFIKIRNITSTRSRRFALQRRRIENGITGTRLQ